MNPVEDCRRYTGSKLFSDLSRHRGPVFLQRNLRRALDHHEHHLKILHNRPTGVVPAVEAASLPSQKFQSRLLPTMEMLSKAIKPRQQTFVIQPKGLVKNEKHSTDAALLPKLVAKRKPSADPTWLPAPNNTKITCYFTCSIIVDDADVANSTRVSYTKTRLANLIAVVDDKGASTFSLDMKPFVVTENDLLTCQLANHNTNGGRRWKKQRLSRAVITMGLSCSNSEDASQLISALDPDVDPGQILSPELAELRANWRKLPDCPHSPLPLRRYEYGSGSEPNSRQSKKLEYLLDVDISSTSSARIKDTPLAMCNNTIQIAKNRKYPQPTRTFCRAQDCRITYVFDGGSMGTRSLVCTTLRCVFCPDRLPHPTFDRLHFHYLSSHDHYAFRIHTSTESSTSLVAHAVHIELATPRYERASDNVSDDRELCWIRPRNPFDLQKYLLEGGFNTWASGKRSAPRDIKKAIRPGFMSQGIARSRASPTKGHGDSTPAPHQLLPTPPEEVSEVPLRKRKRYRVPDLKDVILFRSKSKRVLEAGEMLSESDTEPDNSWLMAKHKIDDFTRLTGAARDFAVLFDTHLQSEPMINADRHVCEVVVRFTRANAKELRQPHLLLQFKKKLDDLKSIELISSAYIDYCLALVADKTHVDGDEPAQVNATIGAKKESEPASAMENALPSPSQSCTNRLDVVMIDDSESEAGAEVSPAIPTPSHQTEPSNENAPDKVDWQKRDDLRYAPHTCVCGRPAMGLRRVVVCGNIHCPRREFHMICVGLARRLPSWYCDDCRLPEG